MTNNMQSCSEELYFYRIKHHYYLFMNKKILKEFENLPFIRNKKMIDNTDTSVKALQVYNNDIESPTISLLKKWILL